MTSRRYVKRIWRVPVDRGPVEYLATLCVKALRKHGWAADWRSEPYYDEAFTIFQMFRDEPAADFLRAVEVCVRIMARTYAIEVTEWRGFIQLDKRYEITRSRGFREVKE
jgi:hypothetical protein